MDRLGVNLALTSPSRAEKKTKKYLTQRVESRETPNSDTHNEEREKNRSFALCEFLEGIYGRHFRFACSPLRARC